MQIIPYIFIAIIGASMGSFVSVLNDRIEKGSKGIIFGRSICPLCKKKLRLADLIPLVSYIILKGKCRFCKKKISIIYPALEVFSALAFICVYMTYPFVGDGVSFGFDIFWPNVLAFVIFGIYTVFFTAIFFYDLKHNEVPELYLYLLIGFTLIGSLILGSPGLPSIGIALLIALGFFGGQHVLSRGQWLGDGDIFFSISMAIILGWQNLLVAIAAAYLIGGVASIILLLNRKAGKGTAVPFTPFLILGTYIAVIFGQQVADWTAAVLMF